MLGSEKCYGKNQAGLALWEKQRHVAVLNRMIQIGLTKKSIFKQRFKGGETVNLMATGEKTVLGRGTASEKAECAGRARMIREAVWLNGVGLGSGIRR